MAAVKAGVLALPATSHGAHKAKADENRAAATNATSDERPRMMPAFSGLRARYSDTNFMAVVPRPRPAKVEKATTVVWTSANWPKTSLPRHRAATTELARMRFARRCSRQRSNPRHAADARMQSAGFRFGPLRNVRIPDRKRPPKSLPPAAV